MPENAFQYFVGRRNAACVRMLEQNHEVSNFLQSILEHLVDYANQKGMAFADVKLDSPFVSSDGYIKARISR